MAPRYGPYYREIMPKSDEIDQVLRRGEVWGRVPRNYFQSDIRAVKAYIGELSAGIRGYEFTAELEPELFGSEVARWHERMDGVVEADADHVKITVHVTKVQR